MSQELWQDIPQDLFIKIFVKDIQSFYTDDPDPIRGISLWYDLIRICKKWKNLIGEITRSYSNFHIDASFYKVSKKIVSLLAEVKILDFGMTGLWDEDLKLLGGIIRINLRNNPCITKRGLSYLKNVEYLDIRGINILIDVDLIQMLPKLKILVVGGDIFIYELENTLKISNSKLRICRYSLPGWQICQLENAIIF